MSLLRERLAELQDRAGPSSTMGEGLYVVVVCENIEPVVAAFTDEALADELAGTIGEGAVVSFEPVADNDEELLAGLVRHYLGDES